MLGFQSYWDATYADELANFREHGHAGEVWLLDSNQLSGNIPLTLGSILNLEALFLSNNQLSGSLPNLTGMATLNYMSISNNSFNKSDVTAWFSTLQSLTTFFLQIRDLI
ncbi:probable leucine-rich repeat receptor-like protein kinase At5g49770 [Camellia sinensis]|uniref:probable leucine-rich repeat receptor-like protein kinase At5g49770 n=1 Tax=Camellia sinensis TaxID=4442 RepID=UPI001035D177|nr:probable leucine-rich repeat receptor-like protein kinase At5g49770 [Camellia sinensis]XP_028082060.1 probable leucine-rich repeat receptor-like protein kinase At5g49770 [Camellia sinensis]